LIIDEVSWKKEDVFAIENQEDRKNSSGRKAKGLEILSGINHGLSKIAVNRVSAL
jgi:hypothetical protein